jgi:hypothetical protein
MTVRQPASCTVPMPDAMRWHMPAGSDHPNFHTGAVHPIQAHLAFEIGAEAYLGRLIELRDDIVTLERLSDRNKRTVRALVASRLSSILERSDLTRLDGTPLVLVNEAYGLLGVATGPLEAPRQLRVQSNVSRIDDGEAVEIPAPDEDQPSLQLIAVDRG